MPASSACGDERPAERMPVRGEDAWGVHVRDAFSVHAVRWVHHPGRGGESGLPERVRRFWSADPDGFWGFLRQAAVRLAPWDGCAPSRRCAVHRRPWFPPRTTSLVLSQACCPRSRRWASSGPWPPSGPFSGIEPPESLHVSVSEPGSNRQPRRPLPHIMDSGISCVKQPPMG